MEKTFEFFRDAWNEASKSQTFYLNLILAGVTLILFTLLCLGIGAMVQ